MEYRWLSIILLLFLSSCVIEVIQIPDTTPTEANVVRVVDGDTILLDSGEKVRFVGINTPEKWEYYYVEATVALRNLVGNQTVLLERDITDKDKYGRLLRYVYLLDGTLVNGLMVEGGYAKAYHYPPDVKHYDGFVVLETEAKEAKLGIWNLTGLESVVQESFSPGCNYVASKSGEVYYSKDCKYANRILEKNRVCFESADEAVEAGYRLTKKC